MHSVAAYKLFLIVPFNDLVSTIAGSLNFENLYLRLPVSITSFANQHSISKIAAMYIITADF